MHPGSGAVAKGRLHLGTVAPNPRGEDDLVGPTVHLELSVRWHAIRDTPGRGQPRWFVITWGPAEHPRERSTALGRLLHLGAGMSGCRAAPWEVRARGQRDRLPLHAPLGPPWDAIVGILHAAVRKAIRGINQNNDLKQDPTPDHKADPPEYTKRIGDHVKDPNHEVENAIDQDEPSERSVGAWRPRMQAPGVTPEEA